MVCHFVIFLKFSSRFLKSFRVPSILLYHAHTNLMCYCNIIVISLLSIHIAYSMAFHSLDWAFIFMLISNKKRQMGFCLKRKCSALTLIRVNVSTLVFQSKKN